MGIFAFDVPVCLNLESESGQSPSFESSLLPGKLPAASGVGGC